MNSVATHKIVVAVALVAVFGSGLYFVVRNEQKNLVASNIAADAPLEQTAAAAPAPEVAAQMQTDQVATPSSEPSAATPAPVQTPPATPRNVARNTAETSVSDQSRPLRVAFARPPEPMPRPATPAQIEPAPAAIAEPAALDAAITTSVKSEIATIAPNGGVAVTTTNGVVALAGTVSSQEKVEEARRAVRRVTGVKDVDVSELQVSDQQPADSVTPGS